jgi:Na+/glutamate symporter
MGRDYDAAVMGAGSAASCWHDRQRDGEHGGARRPPRSGAARLPVVPMVGAFIDFINAVIITVCLNL